jgi:hypothetical protein
MIASAALLIEDSCYYSTPEYAKSFRSMYLSIHQGKGHLRLTQESLSLKGKKVSIELPINAIIGIETGEFDWHSKPFGLAYIKLLYLDSGSENTVFLVPAKSPFTPVWKTNQLIATWIETMAQIEGLSKRIKRPLNSLITSPLFKGRTPQQ